MKAITVKALLLTVTLLTPLTLFPAAASGSRGNSRSSSGHSSGHDSGRSYGSGSHGSYGGSSRSYSSYGSRSSRSSHSSYSPSYYSRSNYYRSSPSYYSNSRHYYSRPSISLSIGNGYYGGYYSTLPFGYSSCVVGGFTYYQYGDRYYRPYNSGYVVVQNPYVLERRSAPVVVKTVNSKYDAYPRIWVEGSEYLIDNGEVFQINSTGLVWAELPLGSVAASLPTHATSVWYNEIEYFEAGGLYFQRIPEGYRFIQPPWKEEL